MKKLLFVLSMVVFTACVSHESEIIVNCEDLESSFRNSKIRSISEAVEIAKQATTLLPSSSRSTITVDEKNVHVICSHRSRSSMNDTLMYVVSNVDDNGFTIISAPTSVKPIIAIAEKGTYDTAESNENFQFYVDAAEDYIMNKESIASSSTANDTSYTVSRRNVNLLIQPRIAVEWGQGWPAGYYCPNKIAGCAPIAVAQICSFFSLPSQVNLTFSGRDQESQEIDWAEMKKHQIMESVFYSDDSALINNHLDNCSASDNTHKTIGRFVRQIGELANSMYATNETSTSYSDAWSVIRSFLPNKTYIEGTEASDLYTQLLSPGVAYVRGEHKYSSGSTSGHAWVADATGKVGYIVTVYQVDSQHPNGEVKYVYDETSKYLHFNWGWNGDCNGYFLVDVFNTQNAYQYDHTSSVINTTPSLGLNDYDNVSSSSIGNTASYDFKYNIHFLYVK